MTIKIACPLALSSTILWIEVPTDYMINHLRTTIGTEQLLYLESS